MEDQMSHPGKSADKISILFVSIFFISPIAIFLNIGHYVDDFILITALLFSILMMISSFKKKNMVFLRAINLFLALLFVTSHYLLAFLKPIMVIDLTRFLMELELVAGGTYIAVNSMAAYWLMENNNLGGDTSKIKIGWPLWKSLQKLWKALHFSSKKEGGGLD